MVKETKRGKDTLNWAVGLRDRVEQMGAGGLEESQAPPELYAEMLDALDLLLQQAADGSPKSKADTEQTAWPEALSEQVAQVFDRSFSQWQASVGSATTAAVAKDLGRQLRQARLLCEHMEEQGSRIDDQRLEIEQRLSELLCERSKLARQRKTLAAEMRARKLTLQLEVQQERQTLEAEIQSSVQASVEQQFQSELDQLREENAALCEQIQTAESEIQRLRDEQETLTAELERELAELKAHSLELESELNKALEASESSQPDVDRSEEIELREKLTLAELQIEEFEIAATQSAEVLVQLEELRLTHAELQEELAKRREDDSSSEAEAAQHVSELAAELDALKVELRETRELLEIAEQSIEDGQDGCKGEPAMDSSRLEELERALADARQDAEELREQNSDLAAQVAKRHVAGSVASPSTQFDQESLNWEERKKLILQQLEDELDDEEGEAEESTSRRVEVENVVAATDREIRKKDREIEELRSIVEQQSDTKQGVAIGASAIAQMFESDELIQQERDKLKAIQAEWEQKLRQAEIDLSMERAKLARERSQIEAERADAIVRDERASHEGEPSQEKVRTRKWLEHLGLREEKK